MLGRGCEIDTVGISVGSVGSNVSMTNEGSGVIVEIIEGSDDSEGDSRAEILVEGDMEGIGSDIDGMSVTSIGSSVSITDEGNAVIEGTGVIVGRLDSEGNGTAVITVGSNVSA